ncbi:hypothetical protein LPB140_08755 [Sphingorhabdus lutea]|uniref:Uncharacterized protein n=1 Tax=Sphingorhabdus lutea TaxID=1913578 RepID=A0A1L3JF54_9SPHN|nr:hypothetical protein [Sphingorhabdus lutea]APG63729.1 hypothetical protein LPB140_08755 [Sphingorhabdus lutea]
MSDFIMGALMLTSFALIWGAISMGRREGWGQKPLLMIIAAIVMIANVAIWAIPSEAEKSASLQTAQ